MEGGTSTYFADTSLPIRKQKVAPIAVWDKAASHIEAWAVFCIVLLGDNSGHPTAYNIFLLTGETSSVSLRLWAQAHQKTTFPASLLRMIHQEFNESFRKALERWKLVRWKTFESLRRSLETGNLRPEMVALPGGISPQEQPPHPPEVS